MNIWIAELCLLLQQAATPPAALPAAITPKEIVSKMQALYDRTGDFKAEFRQTLINPVYGRKQVFDGTVLFKKPGKMRWDYKTPDPKLFVSDGKVLWLYEPEDKQAFRQSLESSQLPTTVTFLTGKGKLETEFDIALSDEASKYGESGDHVVKLTPKTPSAQYKHILMAIDSKSFQVKQTLVFDTQGNINQVAFHKIVLNSKVGDAPFTWSPPSGTKIVKPGQVER
jgi:outer membrane lipoprotein carrier protein